MVLFVGMKFIFPLPVLGSLAEALNTRLAKRRISKTFINTFSCLCVGALSDE